MSTVYRDYSPQPSRDNCRLLGKGQHNYNLCMSKTFRAALLEALEVNDESLRSVCEATKVSYEQMKKVKQRDTASTNVDDAVRIANHFGMSIDEFLDDDTQYRRSVAVSLYNQLTEAEIEILLAAARGRADLGH